MGNIKDNNYYYYKVPEKPLIRKLGTIKCDVVEATPFVFDGRLYRMEYFRAESMNAANNGNRTFLHILDAVTGKEFSPFAFNHHFGSAYVDGNSVYAVAVDEAPEGNSFGRWGGQTIHIFKTEDLNDWQLWGTFEMPDNHCFNTNICFKDGRYVMLIECVEPLGFSFRFAVSEDLKDWSLLSEEHLFQKGRYAGGPAIYAFPDDPYYYVLYLEANPGELYVNSIARSSDLINWEYSPCNPVLMYEPNEDKKIANPYLTPEERERIERAWDKNNSDMECCEFMGRTIINYSWGCQLGIEFLAEACYEGPMKEFLTGFFNR